MIKLKIENLLGYRIAGSGVAGVKIGSKPGLKLGSKVGGKIGLKSGLKKV